MNLNPDTSVALMQFSQGKSATALSATKQASKDKNLARIDAAAKDFEAMFIAQMMKPMFEGIKPDPVFGGGKGEEVFQELLMEEYGKLMAETGQIGVADAVKQEMIRMQEEAKNGGGDVTQTSSLQEETNATN